MRQANYFAAIAIATIAMMSSLPPASSLIISPFLLNFITGHHTIISSRVTTIMPPPRISHSADTLLVNIDFTHDDDLMRVKHELLMHIYQKSLTRGFVGGGGA
jgi:hypothetical protein